MKKTLAENAYLNGSRGFMEQYGAIIVAANFWRLLSFILSVAVVILIGGYIALSLQIKVIPFAVEFNEHAEVARVVRLDQASGPDSRQTRAAIRKWLIGLRTVYGDLRALNALLDETYAMTLPGSAADKAIRVAHEDKNPYERAKKELVEVTVNSVQRLGDGDTWRIEWTETTKQSHGQAMDTKAWQGLVTVKIIPPVDEKQILINPMGVYVSDAELSVRQL